MQQQTDQTSETKPQGEATSQLESFQYDDGIVRMFFWATIVWAIVGMAAGLVLALQLAVPQLNFIPEVAFGRLRPLHTNAAIFAFAGNAIFTAVYYSTQRVLKTRMWSDLLGKLHFWGWQLIIVSAALTLPFGITQGKEYAELEWPIDLAIAVVWLGFFGTNFLMTMLNRREQHVYVALWFYTASIVTVAILHVFNNLWIPVGLVEFFRTGEFHSADQLMKSYPLYAGVQDAFMQWWYGHNAVAFFLTTPFLGLMYYFLPKAAGRPVFSYRLSIVHFWSLVFIYIWAGPHHLHYTALPLWASSLGMVFSLMLWMPSWGGMINGLLTLRGAWNKVTADPVLKFFVVGVTFYGMSTFEGPMLSVKSVNALSHYTDWTIGHVHSGTLGWNGFMTFGMLYWLAPRLFQTKLFSPKMASLHFWTSTIGILLYVVSMDIAGITQGMMWRAFDQNGTLAYPDFLETVIELMPFYWLRALGGGIYVIGTCMCFANLIMTWRTRPKAYEVPTHQALPLKALRTKDPVAESRLGTNIDLGVKADKFLQAAWHRRWERKPVLLTVWVVIAVGAASLFEIIPTFLIKSNVPTIASVQPYTPLELMGRDIYIAEGCYNCHSQMIRPLFAETKRYGEYSKPGEFVYDHPFQWGSRRIGPDLARGGPHDYSEYNHWIHFYDPRFLSADSIMPPYRHLLEQDTDYGAIESRVRAMAMIGVPYGDAIGNAEAMARAQAAEVGERLRTQAATSAKNVNYQLPDGIEDKKAIALIAYLKRVGKDISKPAPTASEGGDQ